jgi:hypothetical protein
MANENYLLSEAAKAIEVPYLVLYRAWRNGKLPYTRRGAFIFVSLDDAREAVKGYKPRGSIQPEVTVVR